MHNLDVSHDVSRHTENLVEVFSGQLCVQVTRNAPKRLTNCQQTQTPYEKPQINTGLNNANCGQIGRISFSPKRAHDCAILKSAPPDRLREELKVMTALLRIPDVQKLLQASRSTVYRLVDSGQLERVHLGSSARIIDDSVYAFIEKLRNESDDLANGTKQ
jgi:excisionase family DNA binding protein